jgi:hypothetical protein
LPAAVVCVGGLFRFVHERKGISMSPNEFRKADDWFTVHAIRTIDDPNGEITRRELVVSLLELPYLHDDVMHLGPNPRRPFSLNSAQRSEIRESLVSNGEQFHHLNRGLTIVAKRIDVDDAAKGRTRVRLHLAEDEQEAELFGLLDGGHTNEIANDYRREVIASENGDAENLLGRRYVNVQVLVPSDVDVTDEMGVLLRSISRARNNNVQVKRRDLENLAHAFDSIKTAIANEPYANDVRWRDDAEGKSIDGQTLLILLMMFHKEFVSYDDDPVAAYGQKGLCLEEYNKHREKSPDYTAALVQELPTLLKLFDRIEREFPDAYNEAGGKFGKFSNVKKPKNARTQLGTETPWKYTTAWVYPIYAGFRQLLKYEDGQLTWTADPIEFWDDHKVEIVKNYSHPFREIASSTATKVGRHIPAFQACRLIIKVLARS